MPEITITSTLDIIRLTFELLYSNVCNSSFELKLKFILKTISLKSVLADDEDDDDDDENEDQYKDLSQFVLNIWAN